jgi:hypothetical protein
MFIGFSMVTTTVFSNTGNLGPKADGRKYLIGHCHKFEHCAWIVIKYAYVYMYIWHRLINCGVRMAGTRGRQWIDGKNRCVREPEKEQTQLDQVWSIVWTWLEHIWSIFGPCLEHVWTMVSMFMVFIGQNWHCQNPSVLYGQIYETTLSTYAKTWSHIIKTHGQTSLKQHGRTS